MNKCEGVVLHHSVTPQDLPLNQSVARINAGHRKRQFPMSKKHYYVGYHYVIAKNGEVRQTRFDYEVGAHSPQQQGNFKYLGVALIGNFNNDVLEGEQYDALISLLRRLAKDYNWAKEDIHFHQEFKPTACPGKDVIGKLPQIREDIFNPDPMISPHAKEAVKWASKEKLIQNWDEPQAPMSRENFAVVLHRFYKMLEG